MICPTCGGKSFSFEQVDGRIQCIGCDRVFMRDELIRENGLQIDAAVEDLKKAIISDVTRDFRKIFKRFK